MSRTHRLDEIEFKTIEGRPRKKRKKKHYFLRFLLVVVFCCLVYLFLSSNYFQIEKITVSGNQYYTDEEVISIGGAKTGGNLFFEAEGSQIEERLLANPYFEEVDIKRHLPNALEIVVTERAQTAAVVLGDQYVVIDEEGTVLRKTEVMPKITLLTGLTVSKMEEGEKLDAEEKENLATTLQILHTMEEGDLYFKKIDFSNVVIRAYIYDYLLVKGSPDQIMDAIQEGQLQKVIADLFADDITRGTINVSGSNYVSFSPETE